MTNPPKWLKIFFAIFPFVSLFFFPWPMTLVASFAAGLVFPPLALVVGILVDVLYSPGTGWFIGATSGVILCALSYGVRHIVKTRIM
ncbi:MAG: hypothetical protein QOE22_656 [Candidatus Parcubacteria bacterium]|jgi:hypothetical protein|nr:hypothetical protein [Candidatus Parcubacteria bacterium]